MLLGLEREARQRAFGGKSGRRYEEESEMWENIMRTMMDDDTEPWSLLPSLRTMY